MPMPRLIHPVPVEIKQISKATTLYDDDAREPIQFAARDATVTVQGQPNWISEFSTRQERAGTVEDAAGYVLFRYTDLEAKGVVLQREDRLIKIGGVVTDVYIKRLQPTGHYDDMGGPTMVKAYFVDRQPSKQ